MTPFRAVPPAARGWLLAALAVLTVGIGAHVVSLDTALRHPAVPHGGLSYQFAWTHDRVREIMNAWGAEGRALARAALHADFAFLLTYPLLLSLACAMAAARPASRRPALGMALSWIVLCSMPADAAENLGLLRMLGDATRDRASDVVAVAVGVCATVKFGLVLSAVVYLAAEALAKRKPGRQDFQV